MKFAVVVFPGSDSSDMYHAITDVLGVEAEYVWHTENDLSRYDGVLLTGGFSYGDYLRPGAIASNTNVAKAVQKAAEVGKPVLGVCNGFQILLEAGLLPGAMQENEQLTFICRPVHLVVENNETTFTSEYEKGEVVSLPVAHGQGNYYCDEKTLAALKENKQIVFRYQENINGSVEQIAGILNEKGNVLGMMPFPERAVESLIGSEDGVKLFKSILRNWRESNVVTG